MSHAFFDFIENTISPIAARAGTQRHIMAVRDGFIGAMPFMIVGSFLLVFAFPPFSPETTFGFGQWWLAMSKEYVNYSPLKRSSFQANLSGQLFFFDASLSTAG